MTKKIVNALVLTNLNGGFYECGRHYGLVKKREVALAFLELQELSPDPVSIGLLARQAKVGWHCAKLVEMELRANGGSIYNLVDPSITHHNKTTNDGNYRCRLSGEEEMFLLSLRAEDRKGPNLSYIQELFVAYGKVVNLYVSFTFAGAHPMKQVRIECSEKLFQNVNNGNKDDGSVVLFAVVLCGGLILYLKCKQQDAVKSGVSKVQICGQLILGILEHTTFDLETKNMLMDQMTHPVLSLILVHEEFENLSSTVVLRTVVKKEIASSGPYW